MTHARRLWASSQSSAIVLFAVLSTETSNYLKLGGVAIQRWARNYTLYKHKVGVEEGIDTNFMTSFPKDASFRFDGITRSS